MKHREHQICKNCIMDTTDPKIIFDDQGQCDHCNNFYANILPNWHPDNESEKKIMEIADKIKKYGKNKTQKKMLKFNDYPDFRPNLTPRDMFTLGSFGGTYWRPIKSGVTGKPHKNEHLK